MNNILNINLKLEMLEGIDKQASEIVLESIMSQIYDVLDNYQFADKEIKTQIGRIIHIDDNWDAPEGEYDWR